MTMAIARVAAFQAGWGICVPGAAGRPWDDVDARETTA